MPNEKFGLPGVRGLVAKCPSGPWNGCPLSSDLIVEYPRNVRAVAAPSFGRLKKMKNLSKQSWKKSSQWRRKKSLKKKKSSVSFRSLSCLSHFR